MLCSFHHFLSFLNPCDMASLSTALLNVFPQVLPNVWIYKAGGFIYGQFYITLYFILLLCLAHVTEFLLFCTHFSQLFFFISFMDSSYIMLFSKFYLRFSLFYFLLCFLWKIYSNPNLQLIFIYMAITPKFVYLAILQVIDS